MRIYYDASFKTEKEIDSIYFDAIAFTAANGVRYSLDIIGEHDFEVKCKDGVCTVSGRVKGDCNSIVCLNDPEDFEDDLKGVECVCDTDDYTELPYGDIYKLLKDAKLEDFELVLTPEDEEDSIECESYDVEIELNGCEQPLSFSYNCDESQK